MENELSLSDLESLRRRVEADPTSVPDEELAAALMALRGGRASAAASGAKKAKKTTKVDLAALANQDLGELF